MLRHHIGLTPQQIEQVNQRLGQEDAILHQINTWKERAKQAKTCPLARCLVYTNLFICLLFTFLKHSFNSISKPYDSYLLNNDNAYT